MAAKLNSVPKYVASRTLDTLEWANSSLLEGDVPDAVRRLKAEDGDPLLVIGSSELVQTLIQHDLVDTFTVWTFPVVLGGGKRLFGEGTIPAGLELTDIQTATTGVTVATYERAGDIRYGSFALDE
jgi:dihydrofolate reductase